MQPASLYKFTRLAEPQRAARRDALAWLAERLQWERTLDHLRSTRGVPERKAA
jgi:hypothetical protein